MASIDHLTRRSMLETTAASLLFLVSANRALAARTSVGLQCVTMDGGSNRERHFTISFDPTNIMWKQSEPGNTSDVFRSKSGSYVVIANTTSLKNGNEVVAILRNFNPDSSQQGESGSDGKATQTGRVFQWNVDIVIP